MEDKTVTVTFEIGDAVVLSNDAPDIGKLIKQINENRDSIDTSKIMVESSLASFDCESFREVVCDLIDDYLKEVKLDLEKYETAIGAISK